MFLIVPDTFMNQPKTTVPILTLLAIPPLALTFIIRGVHHNVFIFLINLFAKLSPKRILHEDQLLDKLEVKFNEVKRYGGTFSLILISITIPLNMLERVKQTMLFILFFDILKENIRKTDQLGIVENGSVACVLSNNNNLNKADLQSKRLIAELEKNPLLKKKLNLFKSEYKCVIEEFSQNYSEAKEMMAKVTGDMRNALLSAGIPK